MSFAAFTRMLVAAAATTLLSINAASAADARKGVELMMFDSAICEWCELWEEEIGVVYHKTEEAESAPLIRTKLHQPTPDGVALARSVNFTPTFVLLEDGREVGRIEGYPGEDFFWPMLQILIKKTSAAGTPTEKAGNDS